MDRRSFFVGSLASLAAFASHVAAQGSKKVWRVGYISMASPEADRHWVAGLRQGLRDLGYVDGQNLVLEQRHASNEVAKVAGFVADLVRRDVAVILVYGSPAIAEVKRLVSNLPVVILVHADPVGSGVVASLARPGRNITGLTDGHADLAPKRLELLKETMPSMSRVAAILNPSTLHAARQLKLLQAAAPLLGLTVIAFEVRGPQDIELALDAMVKERVDGIVVIPDPSWWVGHSSRFASLAIRNRLPAIGTVREFADHGVLLAYGTNFTEQWRKSATYVDKILKGANPADLPIEQPTKFDLIINLKTAKAIGITVPRALLLRADQVIE